MLQLQCLLCSLYAGVNQAFRCLTSTCKNPQKEGTSLEREPVLPQGVPGEKTPWLTHLANDCQCCFVQNLLKVSESHRKYTDMKAHRGNLCFLKKKKTKVNMSMYRKAPFLVLHSHIFLTSLNSLNKRGQCWNSVSRSTNGGLFINTQLRHYRNTILINTMTLLNMASNCTCKFLLVSQLCLLSIPSKNKCLLIT